MKWRLGFLLVPALALACSGETTPDNNNISSCNGGKCDGDATWLSENVGDRDDMIAEFLRERSGVDDSGLFSGNYQTIQLALTEMSDCDAQTASNYVISENLYTGSNPFPRLVSSVCTNDDAKRFKVFMSPPDATADGDLDIHTIEMFAWDETEKRYNFYKTSGDGESDEITMEVSPDACAGCHLGPIGLDTENMPMLPVMNELEQPWQHWNAQPGFDSQQFDLPSDVEDATNYAELAGDSWLGSASVLEQTIRRGFQVVAEERVRARRNKPASISETMSLLRPLFCDEQINYVSEAGTSGQLPYDVVIDSGLRDLVRKERADWPHKWLDPNVRLRMDAPTGDRVDMIPVRGMANIIYENALVSRRGIDSDEALQIRLIDFQTPVFSAARCALWSRANAEFNRKQPDIDITADTRNLNIIPILTDLIMTVNDVSLLTGEAGKYYTIATTDLEAAADLIGSGEVPSVTCDGNICECPDDVCIVDLDEMVGVVEGYINKLETDDDVRDNLFNLRQDRVCIAAGCYSNRPAIDGLDHCSDTCALDEAFSGF